MANLTLPAKITLDKTGFDAGINAAAKKAEQFGKDLKTQIAGAFTAAAVTAAIGKIIDFARESIQAAEAVGDLAERLNMGTEDAQAFALAAKTGGADVAFMAAKIEKLRDFMSKGGSLADFGIESGNLTEVLNQFSELSRSGMSDNQLTKFAEIFGKGAGRLVNVLGDLKEAREAMRFSREDVDAAKDFEDSLARMVNTVRVFAVKGMRNFGFLRLFGSDQSGEREKRRMRVEDIAAQAEAAANEESDRKANMATQERIVQMEKETIDLNERARKRALTDEQRLLEIKQEIAVLENNLATETPDAGGLFGEGYYMMQKRMAELRNEMIDSSGKIHPIENSFTPFTPQSDQFQRIGAFTGSAGQAAQMDLARRNLTVLERLRDDLVRRGVLVRTE